MLPWHTLVVDIFTNDLRIDEQDFRAQVEPSLIHLSALKGAFDRIPCTPAYYQPGESERCSGWAARMVVLISVGKQRAEYLCQLYESIATLIVHELPQFDIEWQITKWKSDSSAKA